MTPEEAQIKQQTWPAMRQRNGDKWVEKHAKILEALRRDLAGSRAVVSAVY